MSTTEAGRYQQSETYRAAKKRYNRTTKGRAARRRYLATETGREANRLWQSRYRQRMRRRKLAARPFHDCRVKVMDATGRVVQVLTPEQFRKRHGAPDSMPDSTYYIPGAAKRSPDYVPRGGEDDQ